MNSSELAQQIGRAANEKKAENVIIMDMRRVSDACDFFVVCGATSNIRARTIAENIESRVKTMGMKANHREGAREGRWILLDYGDVVAHVFQEDTRKYYDLEHLWGDAPKRVCTDES